MKSACISVAAACAILCGCPSGLLGESKGASRGGPEWTDFRRSELRAALMHFHGDESESTAIRILGPPDKMEVSAAKKTLYWVAGSRRGGAPREGVVPTFHVSYLIVKMDFAPEHRMCEISLVEYISHEASPDPFLADPIVEERRECSSFTQQDRIKNL